MLFCCVLADFVDCWLVAFGSCVCFVLYSLGCEFVGG